MLDHLRLLLRARRTRAGERGASAAEYGLLVAGITALAVVVVIAFNGHIHDLFTSG